MIIENLYIQKFRNIKEGILEPKNGINIIFGDNANGKTSYIESIYSISNLKSFRTNKLSEAINDKCKSFSIECRYKNLVQNNLKLVVDKNSKLFLKDSKKSKIDDYLWSLFTIVFKPDDILLVNGSPVKRRELIDKAIFFTDKKHISTLNNYYKILANKNINLKDNKIHEIDNWNHLIAKYSSVIVSTRNKYIDKMNTILQNNLNNFDANYKINKSIDLKDCELFEYFSKELEYNLDREMKYKYSIVGCHRQRIDFSIDGKNLKIFGSQGQKRAFVLLFRSSQIVDFESINNFTPILLLDDMASELDKNNRNNFFNILDNFSGQTFITTTDNKLFSNSDKVSYFCVEDGNIKSFS